jgi:hypothetical protein
VASLQLAVDIQSVDKAVVGMVQIRVVEGTVQNRAVVGMVLDIQQEDKVELVVFEDKEEHLQLDKLKGKP